MRRTRAMVNAAGWLLSLIALLSAAEAQDAAAPKYLGTADCERCHKEPLQQDRTSGALDRVQLTESVVWRTKDRHANAYTNLQGPLGEQIGQLMGVDVLDVKSGCVQCHATSVNPDQWASRVDFAAEGVGCEACHGPSSEWDDKHNKYPQWQLTPESRKAALGWIDVRSPVERAEVCLSCHVGSERDGRVITHAMYAAGHPPLAGFEIESFANRMPVHWRYPYEKPGGKASFERTQNILVAAVVALRMNVEMALTDVRQHHSIDLARFDCFACHHDLSDSQWRQLRPARGVPGRPQLNIGSLPLVEIAAEVVAGERSAELLGGFVDRLQAPLETATFGDAQTLAEVGPQIVDRCRRVEDRLARPLTAEQARMVLHDLTQAGSSGHVDFDTARQILGAWCVVYEELVDNQSLGIDQARQRQVDSLLTQIRAGDFFVLDRLQDGDVRSTAEDKSVATRLPELFGDRVKYQPAKFAAVMKRLGELTNPASPAESR